MSKFKYFKGFIKHLFNRRVSKFSIVDDKSVFHKTSKVYYKVKSVASTIGAYSYIAPRTQIIHVTIGSFCSIASDCYIGLASHPMMNISTSPIFISKSNAIKYQWTKGNKFTEFKQVSIGNDVWIGARVIIMGGVCIGNGVIIGAGSIVTKDIPDYAIAVGIPAKIIKYRFNDDIIRELNNLKWWSFDVKTLRNNIEMFQKDNLDLKQLEQLK